MVELAQVQVLDGTHMLRAAAWKGFEGTPDIGVVEPGSKRAELNRLVRFESYVRFEPS